MSEPHSHHLTVLGRLALKMPGDWAWAIVLRLRLATRRCRRAEHTNGSGA